jgi:hypothetical protein
MGHPIIIRYIEGADLYVYYTCERLIDIQYCGRYLSVEGKWLNTLNFASTVEGSHFLYIVHGLIATMKLFFCLLHLPTGYR